MDARLEQLESSPGGPRRFWPPGQHPATVRMRLALARMEALGAGDDPTVRHLRDDLAAFEEGESIAKQRVLRALEQKERSNGR